MRNTVSHQLGLFFCSRARRRRGSRTIPWTRRLRCVSWLPRDPASVALT